MVEGVIVGISRKQICMIPGCNVGIRDVGQVKCQVRKRDYDRYGNIKLSRGQMTICGRNEHDFRANLQRQEKDLLYIRCSVRDN